MAGKPYRALIVDDEESIRAILEMSLESPEWETSLAENITEATKLADANDFDLIITDKNLPDGDGVSFLRYVREKNADITCVMITAFPSVDSAVQTLNLDIDDYLVKPFDIIELAAKLRRLIEQRLVTRRSGSLSAAVASFHRVREHLDKGKALPEGVQLSLLVVLTEAADRALFDELLTGSEQRISTFVASGTALETVTEPVDLLIADATVTSPDIFGLIESVRGLGGRPEVVVVADSPPLSTVTRLMQVGIAQLIAKPINKDKLGTRVDAVIETVRRRKADNNDSG